MNKQVGPITDTLKNRIDVVYPAMIFFEFEPTVSKTGCIGGQVTG